MHMYVIIVLLFLIVLKCRVVAHDEEELGRLGDVVRIVPCMPKSRKKRHVILDFIKKNPQLAFDDKGKPKENTR